VKNIRFFFLFFDIIVPIKYNGNETNNKKKKNENTHLLTLLFGCTWKFVQLFSMRKNRLKKSMLFRKTRIICSS
jgi:hypothetical protein